jgi:RimJ/RimL family protein N-acetyltransferase
MAPSAVILVDKHVHLSEFQPSDEAACVEYLNEKEIYDRTLRIPYPYTGEAFQQWLAMLQQSRQQHGEPVHWAIRNQSGSLIGGIGFQDLELGKCHRAEIGYWLAKPYWGRGIMTAVVQRACQHAFEAWGLAKIVAHVFSFNAASARVLEKCGFQKEGFLRKHHQKDGRFIDACLYGLLRE